MAAPTAHAQHCLFIARADWRDDLQYPTPEIQDPSIWAWELLRRNAEYARDYEVCKDALRDVPASPYPMDPLTHYLCEPDPVDPNMLYKDYAKLHRNHFVYPVKDAVRRKWKINQMPDPTHSWDRLPTKTTDNNQLAWLFACNTVEVINPPDRWTIGTRVALPVTGVCVDNEVLVRLSLTGNLDQQIESLRQQFAVVFEGGNRSGGLLAGEYMPVGRGQTVRYEPQRRTAIDARPGSVPWPALNKPVIRPQTSEWNKIPARQKSLHYILRMADAIASAEQGILAGQLRDIGLTEIQMKTIERWSPGEREWNLPNTREYLFPSMAKALARYFSLHPFPDDARDVDYKTIQRWLSLASDLVVSGGHATVARMNTHKNKKKKQQGIGRT